MTDLAPRLFADAGAVRRVGEGLLARTCPVRIGRTRHILRPVFGCCWNAPTSSLKRDLPTNISSYNESVGGVNDDQQGYHETLTQLYMAGVRNWLADKTTHELATLVNQLLMSPIGRRDWLLTLYSRDLLFSVPARRSLVMPDLGSWPGGNAPTK